MDSFEGKNQTQVMLQSILLKYGKDFYTLPELEQLLPIFWTLYNNLVRRMGQLTVHHQRSMSKNSEYSATSTSEAVRYLILQDIISNPRTALTKEFSNAMRASEPLVINDYAFGKGAAINALIRNLLKDINISLNLKVRLMDIKEPTELLKFSSRLSQREEISTYTRDLREMPNPEFQCKLGIIGYVYFYLDMEDFFKALLYRLKESQFIAVLPAGSDFGRDISAMIIGKVDGEYTSTIESKDENTLLSEYYTIT